MLVKRNYEAKRVTHAKFTSNLQTGFSQKRIALLNGVTEAPGALGKNQDGTPINRLPEGPVAWCRANLIIFRFNAGGAELHMRQTWA